jgi:hypothetical protein
VGPDAIVRGVFARISGGFDGSEIHPERFVGESDTVVMIGRYKAVKSRTTDLAPDAEVVPVRVCRVWREWATTKKVKVARQR